MEHAARMYKWRQGRQRVNRAGRGCAVLACVGWGAREGDAWEPWRGHGVWWLGYQEGMHVSCREGTMVWWVGCV